MSYISQEEQRKSKRFRETSLPQLEFDCYPRLGF